LVSVSEVSLEILIVAFTASLWLLQRLSDKIIVVVDDGTV
jgi:hypothetical protein